MKIQTIDESQKCLTEQLTGKSTGQLLDGDSVVAYLAAPGEAA